jgi:hypothetical protein
MRKRGVPAEKTASSFTRIATKYIKQAQVSEVQAKI